ncbi:MAG: 50S ribosomal protein L7/L12 [Chloroflexi bacterium]|nr:50S ribosomal protein L7/L12 [Chloroflexota bacterium]MCL5946592.1 50S ribosomal protein L7/L12 [Chloroflexota bacterium]
MTKEEIIEGIKQLNVLELVDLIKSLESTFGVSAAPIAVVAPAAGAPAAGAPAAAPVEEEKTEFDIILVAAGANKINVIKAIREVNPNLGLKEAKAVADEAPKPVREGVSKEEAEKIATKLKEAGATVEVK